MMQKSTTFTTIFRVKKCYFHYDFACKKVPLSLRYAKKQFLQLNKSIPKVTNVRRLVVKQDLLIFRSVLAHHLLKYIAENHEIRKLWERSQLLIFGWF
jgi:hypothetical protein